MTACGYTPSEIDEMTFFDVADLFAYWRENPPAHEILQYVYRIAPKPMTAIHSDEDPSGIGALITRFPDGQVKPI
jgi:hypothetical protein